MSVESGRGAISNASGGHKASGLPCRLRPIEDGLQLGGGIRAVGIAVVYLIVVAYSESLCLDSREDCSCCRVSVGNLIVYIVSLRPNEHDIYRCNVFMYRFQVAHPTVTHVIHPLKGQVF